MACCFGKRHLEMKTGFGLTVCLSMVLFSAQAQWRCVKGDCYEGHGVALFSDGSRYEGQFSNGRINGLGALYFANGDVYSGQWVNQLRQGRGRLRFKTGDEYLGEFHQNYLQGQGKMVYANQQIYEGSWWANQPQGRGVLVKADKSRYEGGFLAGKFEGDGRMTYAEGSVFVGKWKNGLRTGYGTLTTAKGTTQQGYWENDRYMGSTPLQVEQSRVVVAKDTSRALRNCNLEFCAKGPGQYIFSNSTRYEGQFINGLPEGQGRVFYPNGDRYEGGWQRSYPHGRGIMYYTNGQVLSAWWNKGQPATIYHQEQVAANPPPAPGAGVGIKVWAIIIGAAAYTHMPALSYTDDDAYQVYAFLKSPEGGALPEGQLQLLIDEEATRGKILNAIETANRAAGPNDVFFFYFSGHGIPGAFLPIDYDGYNNLLYHETLRDLFDKNASKHKIVVADACYAGTLAKTKEPLSEAIARYYQAFAQSKGGMALLLSSKGEEYSLEDNGLRSGVFSHYLIKGLRGAADRNADGLVSVKEGFDFVYRNVRLYTANVQTPVLIGNFDEKMPFAVVR